MSGTKITPSKSSGIGLSDPVLPGESPSEYQSGLKLIIEQLEAKTVLQIYLAEKIYDCLWWIQRYQQQKRMTLLTEMAIQLQDVIKFELVSDGAKLRDDMAVGQRRVATNALAHGLSVPVDPLTQRELVAPILDRLASEDLPEPVRLDLATKIAEFERNIAHQWQRFADSMSGQELAPRDVLGIDEVFIEDILDLKLEAEQDVFGSSEQAKFLKESKAALKSLRRWGDRQAKRELNEELRSTERYYRRAANQLTKTLRAL